MSNLLSISDAEDQVQIIDEPDKGSAKARVDRQDLPKFRTRREAALHLAEAKRFKVYPVHSIVDGTCTCGKKKCPHPGKHPVMKGGFNAASRDADEIAEMWRRNLDYNVGIATGQYTSTKGLLVIDIDKSHNGFDSLDAMQAEYGRLPETQAVRSGGGGLHLYFFYVTSLYKLRSPTCVAGYQGIDARADCAGIVAPPSNHFSGGTYEWVEPLHKIAAAPEWLSDLVAFGKTKQSDILDTLIESDNTIPEGLRNQSLYKFGSSVRRSGSSKEEVLEVLRKRNSEKCSPPVDEEELAAITENVFKYGKMAVAASKRKSGKEKREVSCLSKLLPFDAIDMELAKTIRGTLDDGDKSGGDEDDPKRLYYSSAGAVLIEWMSRKGVFIRTTAPKIYYLFKETGILYDLEDESFLYFLYRLSGINPKDHAFDFLHNDCRTAATLADEKQVHRFSYWDHVEGLLYVSARNGDVYRFDGATISTIRNGESVFFFDRRDWDPIVYDASLATGDQLDRFCREDAHWDGREAEQSLALKAWLVSLFFPEHCESKPLLLMRGEAGSGKTTLLRLILRFLYGVSSQVTGVPEKEDAFMAAAASTNLLVMDNLDTSINWMRDRLAMLATGGSDSKRKLYTTNEQELVSYNCFIAFTSRTPDTLKRDDLSSRLLVLRLAKIEHSEDPHQKTFTCERVFKEEIRMQQPVFWADMFALLSSVVKELRSGSLPTVGRLRFADWECLARFISRLEESEATWDTYVDNLLKEQNELLIEEDPIIEAIESGFERGILYEDRDYEARELFDDLSYSLFGKDQAKAGWYKSVASFSKRLNGLMVSLGPRYGLSARKGTTKRTSNKNLYRFHDTGATICILKDLLAAFAERQDMEMKARKEGKSVSKQVAQSPYVFDAGLGN